ncbi:MAG: hypothetical protein RL398_2306 [Planctomycetota bacterium]|jgi:hypothetical protein
MYDIEAAIAARNSEREKAARATREEVWNYAFDQQLHRRWLALYRGDHWSLERIAALDGATIAQVWCGLVLALRDERRARRHWPRHPQRSRFVG